MVFVDRTPRKHDRWLTLKVWSFSAGSVLAVVGMAWEANWMVYVAIGVLAVGFAARFFPQGEEDGEEEEEEGGGHVGTVSEPL